MRNSLQSGFMLLISLIAIPEVYAQITRPIGVNLSYVSDYSTELVFTNAFRQCREWISSNADNTGPWDTGVNIPLRPDGYPLQIPYSNGVNPPQKVKTLLIWDLQNATPTGLFRLKSSGSGQIRLSHGASGTYTSPVDTLIQVNNGVILEILSSSAANPVHDIKFILPAYVNTYQNQTFTNELQNFVADFQVLRFMDFTNTNGSPIISWSDRTPANYYTQAKFGGVAWEYVCQLANENQKDVWVNIPHQANDNYISSLATFLQNNLNTGLKVYLEYSNEIWNGAFAQNAYCAQMGQNLGYSGQPWERAWKYTAKRSADVFHIFENVFTNDERLVKIIPSQAANSWLTNELITFFNDPFYNPNQVSADAVAIAPYFGNEVADDIVANGLVNSITIPQIIDLLEDALLETQGWITANQAVANDHDLLLICYEGGQHLVATGGNVNNNTLTQKLIAANRDPAMQTLYCQYLNFWYNNAGNMFCHFSSTQPYTQWGSWGLMEDHQDTSNPKYLALEDCVFSANSSVPAPVVTVTVPGSVCAGAGISVSGTVTGSVSTGTWTSSGTGSFANATALSTTYSPSAADISAGSVVLTLTSADPLGPAGPGGASATVVIHPIPAVALSTQNNSACAFGTSDIQITGTGGPGTFTSNAPSAAFSSNGNTATLDVSTACAGTWQVTYTVIQNGCSGSATTPITVQNCGVEMSGVLKFVDNMELGVANALVTLSEGSITRDTETSNVNGAYQLGYPSGNSFSITATKNRSWSEGAFHGITAADAAKVLQHAGAIPAFQIQGAYKRIAADVNRNGPNNMGIINTADASLILQALTGSLVAQQVFVNRTWVFVPESQVLTTANWTTFQTSIGVTNPCAVPSGNFIGIKLGDVTSPHAIPGGSFSDESTGVLRLRVRDEPLREGEEVVVEFRSMELPAVIGGQLAMSYDAEQLEIQDAVAGEGFGVEPIFGTSAQGKVYIAFAGSETWDIAENTAFFRLRFRVRQGGSMLSQALFLNEAVLSAEVYTTEALIPGRVELTFSALTKTTDMAKEGFKLFQNWPNPFRGMTIVGYEVPEPCEVRMRIYELSGRVIAEKATRSAAGYQEMEFNLEAYRGSGVLFCEMVTPSGILTRKILKVSH